MNTGVYGDFQIYISVPLSETKILHFAIAEEKATYKPDAIWSFLPNIKTLGRLVAIIF